MSCVVGITSDPWSKRRNWESLHPEMENWEIIGEASSIEEAEKLKTAHAKEHGCDEAMPSAEPDSEQWFVFHFAR
ncbi:hypothetical protein HOF92_08400 [bacterium]|nr:hypothetical protein [bacterium]